MDEGGGETGENEFELYKRYKASLSSVGPLTQSRDCVASLLSLPSPASGFVPVLASYVCPSF